MAHSDFSRIFVDRPILAAVLSILIFVAGLIALPNLPVSEYPEVVPPSVQVTAIYPGANPKTIADTVAAPLEEAINGVERMIYMKSVASSDGTMSLTVTFSQGTDIDLAAVQVQNRVAQASPRLPEAVRQLGITTAKASPNITMVVHLTSPDKRYDALYLSNFANLRVKDDLARLPGVGQALAFGAGNYAMRIWLDPDAAASRGLTASDVLNAVREQNQQVSAGAIGAAPMPGGVGVQLSINAQGRLDSPEAFGEIVIKSDGSAITRLKDVARIELGSSTYAMHSLLENEDAAAIVIFEAPGANSIALSDAVRARMAELAQSFPEGVKWSVEYDPTVFVRHSIDSVIETLLEAVALVVLVVVLFLQTWRASLIPLLAVPVSIIGTFAVLWLLGFSINVLTLFGLVLAIGIVVDDAIVVVENVERHIEEGKTPLEAAHVAMTEVSGPIIAISLVLASVFVPLAFLDGVTGQFYRQFAVTIAASVLISGLNSLTLSPALAAVLLQPHDARKDAFGRLLERVFGRFFAWFNGVFKRRGDAYSRRIGGTIKRSGRLLAMYVVLLAVAVFAFRAVPPGFIPTQDKQYLFGVVFLPEGATLDRTDAVMRRMGEMALKTPGVENTVQFPGLNGAHFVATPNSGVMFIGLKPSDERDVEAAEISAQLNMQFSQIQDGLAFAAMPPPVLGLGNSAGVEGFVQDRAGLGYGELNNWTQALVGTLRQAPGFDPFTVYSSFQSNVPQLDAKVDRSKAKEQGLVLNDVYEALQVYLGSAYVNDFNLFGRTYSVYAQADAPFRDDVGDVSRLQTRNARGEMVPLGSVVEITPTYGPDPVIRFNGYPAADFAAGINPALMSSEQAVDTTRGLGQQVLPRGMTVEWSGLTYEQVNQGSAALLVFPLCVLLVYLVLSALYESWTLPLTVILIVPMCLLSAMGGVWLVNFLHGLSLAINPPTYPPNFLDNNVFTQIGLVVLMGLACKNAILIVEFARDLEEQGKSIFEAALEACRLRLRPILMTSFAFCAGVLPLVFASGAGSEVRHVMGVTVFAGMLGVTFFGLFFTPVFYVVIRNLSERFSAAAPPPCKEPPMLKPLVLAVSMALLAGCTVGPQYVKPEAPLPAEFDQAAQQAAAQPAQTRVWEAFGDAQLNALIARALQANTTIAQAAARYEETRALRGLSVFSWFPTVTAGADAERSSPSGSDPFLPPDQGRTDTYNAGFDATWEIDLFGSLRNQKRAIVRREQADAAELANARLTIVAETAQAFFALRGAHARLALTRRNLEALGESVELVTVLEENGRGTRLDVARISAQRSSLAAQLANLEAEVVRHEQRLAVLTAMPVADLRSMVDADAPLPQLPELVTVGTPEEWLKRRPDVRAAERRLAAAYSDIGTETAEFFPKLTLLGGFGWTAQTFGDLGSSDAQRWRWGPSLSWRFLDFGRVRQRVRAAEARADGAEAAFHETVLRALEETENALANYRAANRAAVELAQAAESAGEAARLAQLRFEAGADNALSLLDAERERIEFETQAVQADVARATSLAALYKALAGDFAAKAEEGA